MWWAVFSAGAIVTKKRFLELALYCRSKDLPAGRKRSEMVRLFVNALLEFRYQGDAFK